MRENIEELERLCLQAVKRQLISDVPIGSYLVGIDSSSIVAIVSKYFKGSNNNLKTFTVGFDLSSASGLELSFDEEKKLDLYQTNLKLNIMKSFLKVETWKNVCQTFSYHLEDLELGRAIQIIMLQNLLQNM